MALTLTLADCNVNEALNGPAGTDLPSTLDNQIRLALSFIAQLRDGAAVRTGAVFLFPTTTAPLGFVKLNGTLLNRVTYADLFAFATSAGLVSEAAWSGGSSGAFSVGDGSTTFRVPDLRACFVRGLDEARGLDAGRVIGVFQDHANVVHAHGINDAGHAHGVADGGHVHGASTDVQGNHQHIAYRPAISGFGTASLGGFERLVTGGQEAYATDAGGNHGHNVTVNLSGTGIGIHVAGTGISIQNSGAADGHPRNQAYPFYIKF